MATVTAQNLIKVGGAAITLFMRHITPLHQGFQMILSSWGWFKSGVDELYYSSPPSSYTFRHSPVYARSWDTERKQNLAGFKQSGTRPTILA